MQKVGAARLGFSPMDVGAHSLRSGISISVHIDDVLDQTLMVIGWWHWLVFVVYIQQQILLFSTGILVCMSSQPWFRHLWAGSRPPIPPHTHSKFLPRSDLCVCPSDILFRTARPHLHPFQRPLHLPISLPKILLIIPTGGLFKLSNQISCQIPQLGSRKTTNQLSSRFPTRDPSWTFQPRHLTHCPARVHSKNVRQSPTVRPELTPIHWPSKIPSCDPGSTPFIL